jgi:hypothetical protein
MCDPVTIGGIALSAGSMVMNNMAQAKVDKAREGAMTAERIRQNQLDQEAMALNAQSQGRYEDFQGQQDDKSAELAQYFQTQNQPIPQEQGTPGETLPTSASNIVVREQQKQAGKTKAYSDQQAAALGNLRAFGDLLGDTSRLQARDASQIGILGGFKKGSSQVLPYELEAANNKGSGLRTFADILSLGGSAATGYGLQKGGYNLFGTSTPAMTPVTGINNPATRAGLTYYN